MEVSALLQGRTLFTTPCLRGSAGAMARPPPGEPPSDMAAPRVQAVVGGPSYSL